MKYEEVEKRLNEISDDSKAIRQNVSDIFKHLEESGMLTKVPFEVLNILDSTEILAHTIQTKNYSMIYDYLKEIDFENGRV